MAVVRKNQTNQQTPNPPGGGGALRVVEARIEDSTISKTCHQCRQKRTDLVGSCVIKKKDKNCPIKFCTKCILNRYGENAEEVALKKDWVCPKCRGNCNCSYCMKKRGQKPTGILVHTAKATGFSSVSDLLKTSGSDKYFYKKKVKPEGVVVVASPMKLDQENSIGLKHVDSKKSRKTKREELKDINNGFIDEMAAVKKSSPKKKKVKLEGVVVVASPLKLNQENSIGTKHVGIIKTRKTKREELKDRNNGFNDGIAAVKKSSPKKKVKLEGVVAVSSPLKLDQENSIGTKHVDDKKSRKTKREELKDINNGFIDENAAVKKSSPKKIKISDPVHETKATKKVLVEVKKKKTTAKKIKGSHIECKIKRTKPVLKKKEKVEVEVKLPQGNSSITVSGIDLAPEDAGNVFQFLEFCSAFGKALDLRKGQAECVIREMLSGRSKRRQQYSTLTQMIIQLLTVILEDRGETSVSLSATDASWFTAIGECLTESEVELDDFPPEMFGKGISQYEKMNSSKRLKLLNFLCDETLGTSVMRNCIDSQNIESIERKKEAKEKISSAKDKEKQLKQKLQDELAQAVKEKNGIPLLITERDAIVSRINAETKEVFSEMQNAINMISKKSEGSDDAVRTNAVELDDNGLIFWRLNSYNKEQNILLQDIGRWSDACPHEKWVSFSSEEKPEVEKYISFIRMKRVQAITS